MIEPSTITTAPTPLRSYLSNQCHGICNTAVEPILLMISKAEREGDQVAAPYLHTVSVVLN